MIIVILGPTGVGKTKMSVELAKRLNGEVINADSMQIYQDLNIGTAKITDCEKENIKHHLFDIKNPLDNYTVYDYQLDARRVMDEIIIQHKTPIMVGGTGLYIKAALYNYEFNEEKSASVSLPSDKDELYKLLLTIDPGTKIHKNDVKRVGRALQAYYATGNVIGSKQSDKCLYEALFIGLTTSRDYLYEIINKRVDKMINDGLIDEVKGLYDKNIRSKAIMTGIGYKELYRYFDGEISLEEAVALIKQNSRKYAKRQYTFFNHQLPVKWFNVNYEDFAQSVEEVYQYIKNRD